MRKAYKSIISLAVVLIAGLNLIVPAFAQDPFTAVAVGGLTGASGAGLFSSMAASSGVNIGWGNNTANDLDAMWNTLNPDHVYFSGEKHEADPEQDPEDIWDYITVDLGDWLDAQTDFISEFCQNYNVTDNSSGSVNPSYDYIYAGYPMYSNWNDNPAITTVAIPLDVTIGNARITIVNSGGMAAITTYYNGNYVASYSYNPTFIVGTSLKLKYSNGTTYWTYSGTTRTNSSGIPSSQVQHSTPSLAWSSGEVNTSVFDGWENAKVKIPHSISGLSANWDIPEFLGAINTLWSNQQQGQIVIEDTDQPVPPPPLPDTPLGEIPFDDWIDLWGQGIYQQLENQSDALDFIGSNGEDAVEELESIDTNLEDLTETAESIDTNVGIGNGLLGGIKSAVEAGVDFLEGIAENVAELVESVVQATETLIAGILNQIPAIFGVIFGPIKQASSIWHYVVEWIQSISAPMSWIWSMASGTSYNIVLPVYASLAGAVVLAFYKRFGK